MSDEQQNSNSQPEQDGPSWRPPASMEPDSSAPVDAPQSPFAAPASGGGQWQPEQPGQAPYGQTSPQHDPYGQAPQGQNPYGQAPQGQPPYGQDLYAQAPQQQAPYGQAPFGQAPPGQFQANGPHYGGSQFGGPQPGGPQMGGVPPYGSPQQYGLSGPGVPGGKGKSSVVVVVALVAAVLLVLGGGIWAGVQVFGGDDTSTVSGGGESGEDPTPEPTPTEEVPTEEVPTEAVPTEEAPTEAVPTENPADPGEGFEITEGEGFKFAEFTVNPGWTLETDGFLGATIDKMTANADMSNATFGSALMSFDIQFLQGDKVLGEAFCLATFDENESKNVDVACLGDAQDVTGYDQILLVPSE